ncbi:Homeobox protein knotted-1-like [Arachis hypogaea]|uniref:Homeobox protein knotted-1-like n=1 Tax=Arachis hypogaea TaxID=3818 RepID=A0A6B9VB87_ARAHY|nr:Homeobox protein knotted-1-like [Arachis hypogaea]
MLASLESLLKGGTGRINRFGPKANKQIVHKSREEALETFEDMQFMVMDGLHAHQKVAFYMDPHYLPDPHYRLAP